MSKKKENKTTSEIWFIRKISGFEFAVSKGKIPLFCVDLIITFQHLKSYSKVTGNHASRKVRRKLVEFVKLQEQEQKEQSAYVKYSEKSMKNGEVP